MKDAINRLIEKARKEWGQNWDSSMIEHEKESNLLVVYIGGVDVYKAFFDADSLECVGTK